MKMVLMLMLTLISTTLHADETVPMKYCELACFYDVVESLHNSESGIFSSASSSASSLSPLTFAEQYCKRFVSDEKECVVLVYGSGRTSNHSRMNYPFSSISGKTYAFPKK